MIIDRLRYSQNWNIGFCDISPDVFIKNKQLGHIEWMKHPYRDRFFADPFILKVTEDDIIVFAEECLFDNPKGRIVELIIDQSTKRLKQKYLLLETDTHLSYPAIIYSEDKVYVYPENSKSGVLNLFIYDEENHKLTKPVSILDEAVADSTIIESDGKFYLVATKYPETQVKVFLYIADSVKGPYNQCSNNPFNTDKKSSRPGGNFFDVNGTWYRPAQNCFERYGSGLSIMKVLSFTEDAMKEKYEFSIYPQSFRYNLGIHTINFRDGYCAIDGYGYLYPIIGRMYSSLITLFKNFVISVFRRK